VEHTIIASVDRPDREVKAEIDRATADDHQARPMLDAGERAKLRAQKATRTIIWRRLNRWHGGFMAGVL
jgi:hypothetical protein